MHKIRLKQALQQHKWASVVLICIALLLLSLFIEVIVFQFRVFRLPSEQRSLQNISLQNVQGEGISIQDGAIYTKDMESSFTLHLSGQYVNKIIYSYTANESFTTEISFGGYGVYQQESDYIQRDSCSPLLSRSVENIGQRVEQMTFRLPEGVSISNIQIDNRLQIHPVRFVSVLIILSLITFLWIFRGFFGRKIEYGFLAVALGMGCIFLMSVPIGMASWDEQIHFKRAYDQSFPVETTWTQAATTLADLQGPSMNNYRSWEEKQDWQDFYNSLHDYENPASVKAHSPIIKYNELGYLPQSLMLMVGRLLGASFTLCFYLGRMGNLLMYALVCFWAIRKSKVFKRTMSLVLAMPTTLFLACSYTYDPSVTAFLTLGFVTVNNELITPKQRLTWQNAAIFIGAMLLGSFPKAVYIPLILLALLLPKTKFENNKQMYAFKAGIVFLCVIVMATFMMPTSMDSFSDARGGDTSVSRQMSYIFSHPVGYVKVLAKNIIDRTIPALLGAESLFHLAYLGCITNYSLQALYVVILIFTLCGEKRLPDGLVEWNWWKRGFSFVLYGGIICLIWTALYLSFTPVGAGTIAGVQPRYYIPLMIPIFYLFRTDRMYNTFKDGTCSFLVLASVVGFSAYCLLYSVFIPHII